MAKVTAENLNEFISDIEAITAETVRIAIKWGVTEPKSIESMCSPEQLLRLRLMKAQLNEMTL